VTQQEYERNTQRLKDIIRQLQWGSAALAHDWKGDEVFEVLVSLCPLCDQTEAKGHTPDCPMFGMFPDMEDPT
jgi:hypothetical protein